MKKTLKIKFNAPVGIIFAAICLLATALNYITQGKSNELVFMTYHSSLKHPLTYVRLFTHVFGHVSWEHFMGNMSYILLLGPLLEEKHSSLKLVEIIAVTAVITGAVNYIFFPDVALCGASGVVFAFILLSSFTSFKEGEIPLTFILVAAFFIGREVVQGVTTIDDVSQMGHIVGGIIGSILGYVLCRKKEPAAAKETSAELTVNLLPDNKESGELQKENNID